MPKDIAQEEIEQFKWEYEEARRQVTKAKPCVHTFWLGFWLGRMFAAKS